MTSLYQKRIEKVQKEMEARGMDQLIVSEEAALFYLTGLSIDAGERLTVLLLSRDEGPFFVANRLFPVTSAGFPVKWYSDGEDGMALLSRALYPDGAVAVDKTWPSLFLIDLLSRRPDITFSNGSPAVDAVRAVKDTEEIRLMKDASLANDRAMERLIRWLHPGVTERKAAQQLKTFYEEEGAEDVSFPPIISFGPAGADPHHMADDTVLAENTPVLIDIGCKKKGYASDMTRTLFYGQPTEEFLQVHRIVCAANEKAESLVRPGIPLRDLDRAARNVIENAGYGPQFTHRLGHFIGQTDHEAGEVSSSSDLTARPGMIFSIEPGIYLPGRFGVRIEDLVLVTEEGCEILNRVSKSPFFPKD